ncbi:DUF6455 family protein [Reyranella sp.]|uniref:DUF6455 family protein n=1 Tax=Reyranella sp. TaxID=1929291 RepID=UPI003782EF7E
MTWVKTIAGCGRYLWLGSMFAFFIAGPLGASAKGVRVMTTLQDFRQTISRFVDGRRQRRRLRRELAQLAAMGSLDAVLADVGLNRSQIDPLVAGCAGSQDLLDRMLARLGIDAADLSVENLRDMTWTCTTCPDKRHCREWLADVESTDFRSFCPNAAQLDRALSSSHRAPPTGGNPDSGSFRPSADDLRRLNSEARQREVRALLHMAP